MRTGLLRGRPLGAASRPARQVVAMQSRQSPRSLPLRLRAAGAGRCGAAAPHSTTAAGSSASASRLTVVLDMDECLIHTTDFSDDASGYRQHEASRDEAVQKAVETFQLK